MTSVLRVVPSRSAQPAVPLLKWAGGKRWFTKEHGDDMLDLVLERGGRYIEPFLGGAAMALHLGLPGMILGDVDPALVITYQVIQSEPNDLVALLGLLEELGTDKENYYRVREIRPQTPVEVAAQLVYLNKLCFNGLYRRNKQGEFNVPFGESRSMPSRDRILEVSEALSGSKIVCEDALELIGRAGRNDVVYADPPYDGCFADYTAQGFDANNQEALAHALARAYRRGAEVYAHNANTELIRSLYGDWAEIVETSERRSISARGEERGRVSCILIAGVHE